MLAANCVAFRLSTLAFCLVVTSASAVLAAQLPPDVQADRLWLRAERQIGDGEYWSALASLDEILSLQAEHDVAIPESFWFSHAMASHRAGLHTQAAASATRYVESTGREGEHYFAALELLDTAESAAEREAAEVRRSAEQRAKADREAEARRAARQAIIDAQAEATAAAEEEMVEVAAELARLAPGMKMVVIPAGRFRMGCVSGVHCRDYELPVHEVTIPHPFAVSKHEVTFAQWDACAAGGGCLDYQADGRRQRRRGYRPEDHGRRGNQPVVDISWLDAQNYVRWLSETTGATYRLLTEAEWEYAARAGTETLYGWGNEYRRGLVNCGGGCEDEWDRTAPVGSFPPNLWGLHDMLGNVSEWVEDCWNGDYTAAPSDGSAWLQGDCSERVQRGATYLSAMAPWLSVRSSGDYDYRFHAYGFRVARELTP